MSKRIIVEKSDGIGFIQLNDPSRRNALTLELKQELQEALLDLKTCEETRVVVLSGNGKGFCAGGDVKAMEAPYSEKGINENMNQSIAIINFIQSLEKPVIALVHGPVAGAGVSLALACDLVVAEKSTTFHFSFKQVGLVADLGLHYHLCQQVGPWKAKEILWGNRSWSAEAFSQFGMINELVEDGSGEQVTYELAKALVEGPRDVFAQSKLIMNQLHQEAFAQIMEQEKKAHVMLRNTKDHLEGVQAFKEKRFPVFNR
ncbi:enoyl-CoA hydratase/isomerase family protein [Bacillus sp. Marseille-P3800]|uniref:enoyl-CoA hydratase/isomerase family protein n=1 Tax=Bacillus sp. Marseille-P3800 TaxID=2014782 RepID=UPI00159BB196|nr:enoyl-CoA hydratase-related protein [Bacillus sp. Marseille-P3800]